MNTKYEGPFTSAFESDIEGVVKQELITYRIKNGMLRKEVTTREFRDNGKDWNDTSSIQPLVQVD
jgi:hypothetical protein